MAAPRQDEMEDIDSEEFTIKNEDVFTKYKNAADITNEALAAVIKECTPGKKIIDVCVLGDKYINDKLVNLYKGKEKGVAFPTSISVNNVVGHFSPLLDDTTTLNDGDVAKIDLGVQIDGYISVAAHTIVVQATQGNVSAPIAVTGRKADVICAAHIASEVALRLLKPGKKNTDVTNAIKKVADFFKVEPLEGVLSHEMKRYVIDGQKVIINKATAEHKVEEFEFQDNEVYAVDIVMSTGEGKAKEREDRTTIFKRNPDTTYQLKMQASRYVFNEISTRFPSLPFALRALDEKKAKLGVTECLKHELLIPYPSLYEKDGEFVAQFKFTCLITPNGTNRMNKLPLPFVTSEYKVVDPELESLLRAGTKRSKKNDKKKPAKAADTTATPQSDSMDTTK